MARNDRVSHLFGAEIYGANAEDIGPAQDVYVDHETGRAEWVTVLTGLFGTHESFVPLDLAEVRPRQVLVPYSKGHVRDAPTVEPVEAQLSVDEEQQLCGHYGLERRDATAAGSTPGRLRRSPA
jgi:sporulation protein YlmC with PRC-barrel domain